MLGNFARHDALEAAHYCPGPLLGRDPEFAELHDEAAIQAQLRRMIDLINIERAKLGMAPLS